MVTASSVNSIYAIIGLIDYGIFKNIEFFCKLRGVAADMEELTAIEVVDDSKREELKDFLYKYWPDTIEVIHRIYYIINFCKI